MADFSQYKPALTYEFLKHLGRFSSALPTGNNAASLQAIQARVAQINAVIEELARCKQHIEVWDGGALADLSSSSSFGGKADDITRKTHLIDFRKRLAQQRSAMQDILRHLDAELISLQNQAMKLRPNI